MSPGFPTVMKASGALAQLVARRSHNPKVVSSILTGPVFVVAGFELGVVLRLGQLFVVFGEPRRTPSSSSVFAYQLPTGPVAQWIRRRPPEAEIVGSSPIRASFCCFLVSLRKWKRFQVLMLLSRA